MTSSLELRLPEPLRLSESAEVALEDYAREVSRSERAVAVREAEGEAAVTGVRLEGIAGEPDAQARGDILAFARALADAGSGAGLGWS
jgi:hypothetical protein